MISAHDYANTWSGCFESRYKDCQQNVTILRRRQICEVCPEVDRFTIRWLICVKNMLTSFPWVWPQQTDGVLYIQHAGTKHKTDALSDISNRWHCSWTAKQNMRGQFFAPMQIFLDFFFFFARVTFCRPRLRQKNKKSFSTAPEHQYVPLYERDNPLQSAKFRLWYRKWSK